MSIADFEKQSKRNAYHRHRLIRLAPVNDRMKFVYSSTFEWLSRYSATDKPDRYGRWSRLCYYRGYLIAWVNLVKGKFVVSEFFPTSSSDHPFFTGSYQSLIEAKQSVHMRYNCFLGTMSTPQLVKNELRSQKEKPIDKVTVTNLDTALRMVGITFDHKTIDKIIDLVELIEEKGDDVRIKDILELQAYWQSVNTR